MIRRFEVFRPNPPDSYRETGTANAPEEVQFEGVVFSDGTVCVRWLTEFRSHSIWKSLADLERVHGHPEYGTKWRWLDEQPEAAERTHYHQQCEYGDFMPGVTADLSALFAHQRLTGHTVTWWETDVK